MPNFPAPDPPFVEARWHGGPQDPTRGLIVMHSMVMKCYSGAALDCGHYFANETKKTSAHYGVDPTSVIQYVHDHEVAYHCGYNQDSIGVEMADMSTSDMSRWNDKPHTMMLANAAHLVAQLCLAYNIRPYYVGWVGLKLGRKGVTTHAQMTKAFHASTHTDPGTWPRRHFMRMVRADIKAMRVAK